jgi:hypothetical protein
VIDYAGWVNAALRAWATIGNSVARMHTIEIVKLQGKSKIVIDGKHVATVTTEVED